MTSLPHLEFPFTAVAGQENFKLALTLAAINPLLGGVLVSGPRGSAKSTLARGLAHVLPDLEAPFATLPLGASEERLLGTLDLDKVLKSKEVAFHPGLLSKAHGGVLYVDEVNLLADNLVDQLLDVAASGVNRVERDGISHEHAAKFILVGTMNPDEGELRPQLQDRFGLMVELANNYSLDERVQIVKLRDEFDQNAQAFCDKYRVKQKNLRQSIEIAQQKLPDIECSDEMRLLIAKACFQANVDGVRADIVWLRAAMAYTAWRGGKAVTRADLDMVAELVLAHRRQAGSSLPPTSGNSSNHQGNQNPNQTQAQSNTRRPESSRSKTSHNSVEQGHQGQVDNGDESSTQADDDDWGSMPAQSQTLDHSVHFESQSGTQIKKNLATSLTEQSFSISKGENTQGRSQNKSKIGKAVDWHQTITQSTNDQGLQWPPVKLHRHNEKTGQGILHLILLDCSASMLGHAVFGKAKGAILDIAHQAYLKREQISMFIFGNNEVKQVQAKVRAPKDMSELLNNIEAGGGTPFRDGLLQVASWLARYYKQSPTSYSHTYIFTDGRTQADVTDIELKGHCSLIDIESSAIKRGKAQQLAHAINAEYFTI